MKDVQLSLNFFKSNGVILNAQNLYKAMYSKVQVVKFSLLKQILLVLS